MSTVALQALEDEVNAVIRDARAIVPRLATDADFESNQIRCRKLPDVRTGGLRLVDIDGIDLNTCGGTHVSNTAQLQVVRLLKTESHRGATRLFFEVGGRVLTRARQEAMVHHSVNQLLSCSVSQYAESIERLLKETKAAAKTIKALQLSKAKAEAQQMALADGKLCRYCPRKQRHGVTEQNESGASRSRQRTVLCLLLVNWAWMTGSS